MKKVRCPQCGRVITFDETPYKEGHSLVFECPSCHKKFGVRIHVSNSSTSTGSPEGKNKTTNDSVTEEQDCQRTCPANIVVIENVFHYRQVLSLHWGDNRIGRYMKGSKTELAVKTDDPSMDMLHCVLNVNRNGDGSNCYTLRDGPSNTGTFVGDDLLQRGERRVIAPGTLFTLGATTLILKEGDVTHD